MIDIKANDVLLGRGPFCYRNPGNIAFRNLIQSHVASYTRCAPQSLKRKIVQKMISEAQEQGCRFLVRAKSSDIWCEAHPCLVRDKVSHALRDARILVCDMSIDDISNLQYSSLSDKRQKTKSNDKKGIHSFSSESISSNVSIEEGNDIPSIDRRKESALCKARQQPQDLKDFVSEGTFFYPLKTPEHRIGWNTNRIVNSMPCISTRLWYVLTEL